MDPGTRTNRKCDLVKMKEGGLKAVFLAVFVGQGRAADHGLTPEGYKRVHDAALVGFESVHRLTDDAAAGAVRAGDLARTTSSASRRRASGSCSPALENGYPIGEDLANVKKFYDLGARYITLCHSGHNQLADSSTDTTPPLHNGLSEFGKKVVAEMNRLGVLVDVSHIGVKSFWDAIAVSKAPIIASHSGCQALAQIGPQPETTSS